MLQEDAGSPAIIPRQVHGRSVAPGTSAEKLALYKPIKPQSALLPPPVPTVRNHTARRPGLPELSPRRRLFMAFSSEVWIPVRVAIKFAQIAWTYLR